MSAAPRCLRCQTTEMISSPRGGHAFYECPQCYREYMQSDDGSLHDRWLSALSLVLYPVIFEPQPQERADSVADQLCAAATPEEPSIFRRLAEEELE